MSSKLALSKVSKTFGQWFAQLDSIHCSQVLEIAAAGGKEIIMNLRSAFPDDQKLFFELQYEVRQALKKKTMPVVDQTMQKAEVPQEITKPLIKAIHSSLRHYRISSYLRDADDEAFERTVERILVDNYVDRLYDSWEKCDEYLGLNNVEQTRRCYSSVMSLVEFHYQKIETLEELGDYMELELNFNEEKIERFLALVTKHRTAIDRTMLFKKLKRIEELLVDTGA
ncbi:hypothetical protein [Paenibacillus koleovorans]|uniref:hypothetical protein n=1 Tax=Paenibacillus koleovorans TaxID=121608 RepID=UPI000FD73CB0|nr:hypothetical protein [Paenibacillus koleovorans]